MVFFHLKFSCFYSVIGLFSFEYQLKMAIHGVESTLLIFQDLFIETVKQMLTSRHW